MNNKAGLFLMNRKGYLVLESLLNNNFQDCISFVECREDRNVEKDYFTEIRALCISNGIHFFENRADNKQFNNEQWKIAIGWRWLIRDSDKLIIIHDSLLPRYRGFAPVVNALINGEDRTGVTALVASESYDRGDIILQREMKIDYPAKINDVIENISSLYISIVLELFGKIRDMRSFNTKKQVESEATYSIWRDEDDYFIDWHWSADKIKRFVDAVGFPYKGAKTKLNDKIITIDDCEIYKGLKAEILHPGKVIFFDNKQPVVLCGKDAVKITNMICDHEPFELKKLKTRFK